MRFQKPKSLLLVLIATCLVAVLAPLAKELQPNTGFAYETFVEICDLAYPGGGGQNNTPTIESAAVKLSKKDYQDWTRGKFYVSDSPESGAGLHEDFNDDGVLDRLVPVKTSRGYRLIIALGQPNGGWDIFGVIQGADMTQKQVCDRNFLRSEVALALTVSEIHNND